MTDADTRSREERACLGKRRYGTKRAAQAVVLAIAKQDKDETIQPYKCEFCGYWHVGHRRKAWQQ